MTGSTVLSEPDAATARAFVAEALAEGDLVTVAGRCTVESGPPGGNPSEARDRLLLVKPDGTAIVHAADASRPVARQSSSGATDVRVADGRLVVRTSQGDAGGELVVSFKRVALATRQAVETASTTAQTGTEADLRERVLAEPDLVTQGFEPRATERSTPAGDVDVYGVDAEGNTVVVELKRRRVGPDAVGQLDRYVTSLRRDLHDEASVRGILVAPSVTERGRRLLAAKGLEFVPLEPVPDDGADD